MNELVANWPLLVIAAAIALVLLWWLIAASRKTRVTIDRRDTLDEGAAPAARNQALIDAAPAAAADLPPPAVPDAIAGAGVAVAAAVHDRRQDAVPAPSASTHGADDLTRIKGLGPKLATTLADLGVTRFAQIAAWDDAEIDRIDSALGRFQGRIRRDEWVAQARLLADGDVGGFESRFGAT
jgi:predicted flap endonuclease-1-like 5' DNA nuclease